MSPDDTVFDAITLMAKKGVDALLMIVMSGCRIRHLPVFREDELMIKEASQGYFDY